MILCGPLPVESQCTIFQASVYDNMHRTASQGSSTESRMQRVFYWGSVTWLGLIDWWVVYVAGFSLQMRR